MFGTGAFLRTAVAVRGLHKLTVRVTTTAATVCRGYGFHITVVLAQIFTDKLSVAVIIIAFFFELVYCVQIQVAHQVKARD